MHGKFDPTAQIVPGGAELQVSGPVTWDPDEFGAVIHARAWQDGGVVGSGASDFVFSSAKTWTATLSAHAGTFQPGRATVRAIATVSLDNGHTEPYSWPDTVNCV